MPRSAGNQQPIIHDADDLQDVASGKHIVFYDGVCGLCNKFIQFVIENDKNGVFYFAALQSDFAGRTLARHGVDAADLDTVYILTNYGNPDKERLLNKSTAVVFAAGQLQGWLRPFATIFGFLPKPLRDFCYDTVARIRYKLFGKFDHCMLPTAETRSRFIDQ